MKLTFFFFLCRKCTH